MAKHRGGTAPAPATCGPSPRTRPDHAAEIIAARLDGLRANMSVTLRAMKAAAEATGHRTVGYHAQSLPPV